MFRTINFHIKQFGHFLKMEQWLQSSFGCGEIKKMEGGKSHSFYYIYNKH